ncbi:hypothetical protein STEPF1_05644 [Streptomyces sp. F-1]|nr:Tn3 family transposase [Streptomyces sp. F-1]SFY52372.1 hypothetical protein STEPF1_05644 [Streptomyces sp. F-1]
MEEHLAELVCGLDAGWKRIAERLQEAGPAAKVSIEVQDDGRTKLTVDKLGALGEPKSLTWLRKRVEKMLPKIDLPDLLVKAAPSPKYFGFKRGITWLDAVNDQVAGTGRMVVPGTPCDSLHILDTLLHLDGGMKPEMMATDNASYSNCQLGRPDP